MVPERVNKQIPLHIDSKVSILTSTLLAFRRLDFKNLAFPPSVGSTSGDGRSLRTQFKPFFFLLKVDWLIAFERDHVLRAGPVKVYALA